MTAGSAKSRDGSGCRPRTSRQIARATAVGLPLAYMDTLRPAHAETFFEQFGDHDGGLGVGHWVLDNAAGFLPAPIPITEPAVGGGLGAAAIFFRAPLARESDSAPRADGDNELPDVTGIVAAATSNDSWLIGSGHFAHWQDERVRYAGMFGYASISLELFGFDDGYQDEQGVGFNSEGMFTQRPFPLRIDNNDWLVGDSCDFLKHETKFDLGIEMPGVDAAKGREDTFLRVTFGSARE